MYEELYWKSEVSCLSDRNSIRISMIIFEAFQLELLKNSYWKSWKIPIPIGTLEEFRLELLKNSHWNSLKNSYWNCWKIPLGTLQEFILELLKNWYRSSWRIHIGELEDFKLELWCHLQNSENDFGPSKLFWTGTNWFGHVQTVLVASKSFWSGSN